MVELQISLAAARVNARLTQKEVAKKMHISKQTIVNWEKGVTYPKPAYFEMLCRIYNIDRENIFLPSA
nr:helix-turn-helix transcriptional regulator [uncultured Lachnoanaerobaculum sp.]